MTYEEVFEKLNTFISSNPKAKNLRLLHETQKATFADANKYSELIGSELFKELTEVYDLASVADWELLANDIELMMRCGYSESAYYAKQVQTIINEKAGVNMKALEPAVDKYRLENLRKQVLAGDVTNVTEGTFTNTAKSAVSDTIQYNARVQSEAGLKTIMTRHLGADGCCAWCRSMAGTYEYGEQPDDFWRFHHDCDCYIDYKVGKNTSRISYRTNNGSFNKITE